MAEAKQTEVDEFRDSLLEVAACLDKLAPFCKTIVEMIDMIKLATESDGQLRLLIAVMQAKR